jgi:GH25 family lysozyme M1 (1,4-beta-N-acetylmuramidase)
LAEAIDLWQIDHPHLTNDSIRANIKEHSMTTLRVSVAPKSDVEFPSDIGPFYVDAVYTRTFQSQADVGLSDLPSTVQDTVRTTLDQQLRGSVDLIDIAPSTPIDLYFLGGNGLVRLHKTMTSVAGVKLGVTLNNEDVTAITAAEPRPLPRNTRRAFFVTVTDNHVPFESSKLQITQITVGHRGWTELGLDQLFHSDLPITTAVQWAGALPPNLVTQLWTPFPLTVDGQFSFSFPVNSGDAWIWWLSGPLSAIGVVIDDLTATRVVRIGVGLPAFSGPSPIGYDRRAPYDVTEAQITANPNIYTEDPGEFCRPFSNPERVLGERSFFVILRAEQPLISAEATVHQSPVPVVTHVPIAPLPTEVSPAPVSPVTPGTPVPNTGLAGTTSGTLTTGDGVRPAPGTLSDGTADLIFVRHTMPTAYSEMLRRTPRGRTEMNAAHPMQWDDDSSRYQAVTVARGHILELRMRTRSNGYSLGTVAKTLTLAPRQVIKIEKVEFRRNEESRRQETTRLFDQVSDSLSHDRTYEDSVQANLAEWERGESESSMSAGAGGIGFFYAGFLIGGGGASSNANSSSSQEGGRRTSASEEQRLRDTVRRYGDALRKLDSIVVNQVTQEESTTGTVEIVRNPNYGHSLTVIYYQILRHLKVETAVVGVRECLFVPFAISPFTVARVFRWRELIQAGLRDREYLPAIRYLKDVLTSFVHSDVPIGRRSDQPVTYIHGSLFLRLGIERPADKDDGAFDQSTWLVVRPYLGAPALLIYQRLKVIDETQRDAVFQQQHAGIIATSWVDTLTMDASGTPLEADFTIATRYQFNRTVRVDFSVQAPAGVTREKLALIHVQASKSLPPGSVANLESMTFTYATDQFERTVNVNQGVGDLIALETGAPDIGASISATPDRWERTDVRSEMIEAVNDLLEHINQHVEYYTKLIFWGMDRDRLWMLIDGFYVPGTKQVSIASVVERDPVAIIGNALVFRVSAGSFLGIGDIKTPADLFNHYVSLEAPSEPMLVSLPTDGLYAQTIMDECAALEEHFGNTDWVLNDPDPALGEIAPELLASRRTEPANTTPTPLPQTIINLQNTPEAPAVSGLTGALNAVTNANAFRDMAGLAGTQANAAAALQTAANLATNFGNQAAALKLAEMAKDAQNTQNADQKVASLQRAVDKKVITPEDARNHANGVFDQLHESSTGSPKSQREAAVTQAVFAASESGQPFTVQHATTDGVTTVSLAANTSTGGSTTPATSASPSAPPNAVSGMLLGIDAYGGNVMNANDFANLVTHGKVYAILKSSQGVQPDGRFSDYYRFARDSGMIRGSYHFFANKNGIHERFLKGTIEEQANLVVSQVTRLGPGDLAPAFDLEDESRDPSPGQHFNRSLEESKGGRFPLDQGLHLDETGYQYRNIGRYADHGAAGRQVLLADIQDFLDRLETALGRTPLIYTANMWTDSDMMNNPQVMSTYPLWGVGHGRSNLKRISVGGWGTNWKFMQYAEQGETYYGMSSYSEPGINIPGLDFNAFNGSISSLRGLADLGHTAPLAQSNTIAYSDGNNLHVILLVNDTWQETLSSGHYGPDAAGDPAIGSIGNALYVIYRTKNDHVYAVGNYNTSWGEEDITPAGSEAVDDPFVLVVGDVVHVVYWDTHNNQVHLTRSAGAWNSENLTDTMGARVISGSAAAYVFQDSVHIVSRAGIDGHLVDMTTPQGTGLSVDLTADATTNDASPIPPATYRPTTYTPNGQAPRIVFRGLRGSIWQIERDTLIATNLHTSPPSPIVVPVCAGSPSAIFSGTAHILYRTTNGTIQEIFDDGGTWRTQQVCTDAAADPTAFIDEAGHVAASFLATNDTIRVARLVDGAWQCEDAGSIQLDLDGGVLA